MADKHGDKKDTPIQAMWMSLTGASAHLHEEVPGIDPHSQQVGHEPDHFGIRSIVYVPLAVVVALLVTYLIVSGTFAYLIDRGETPHDKYAFNDRAARISSDAPKPLDGTKPAVAQPRLEGVQQVLNGRQGQVDPPYLRSFIPSDSGNNSPQIYPQFLRPENFVDPTTGKKALVEYDWVDKDKQVVQIPIEEAMHLLVEKKQLKSKDGATHPAAVSVGLPKISTGGRGGPAEPKPKDDKHDHGHDHKHDHKDEKK